MPWLRPCPRPQKTFSDRKNQARPVMPLLPSYAGIMPVTEKILIIASFLVKFCFIQN